MIRTPLIVMVGAVLAIAACSGQPEQAKAPEPEPVVDRGWTELAAEDFTEAQKVEQQRCLDAIQTMAGRLMGELTTALDEEGPTGAIEVCSLRAPEISAMVANEYGVVLGRTSFRVRNRSNLPPAWAEPLVERRVADPVWLAGPEGQLAGLVPIRLKAECGMCHGSREQISEDVRAKLDDFYPEDDAIGFAEGDLRGWFWVEVPTS